MMFGGVVGGAMTGVPVVIGVAAPVMAAGYVTGAVIAAPLSLVAEASKDICETAEIGALTRANKDTDYQFGDLTRGILAKGRMFRGGVEGYQFGDFTRGLFSCTFEARRTQQQELAEAARKYEEMLAADFPEGTQVQVWSLSGSATNLSMHPEAKVGHAKRRLEALVGDPACQQTLVRCADGLELGDEQLLTDIPSDITVLISNTAAEGVNTAAEVLTEECGGGWPTAVVEGKERLVLSYRV
jgi:hypothetical protein